MATDILQGVPGCVGVPWSRVGSHGFPVAWRLPGQCCSVGGASEAAETFGEVQATARNFHYVSMESDQDSPSASSQTTSYGSFAAYFLHKSRRGSVAERLAPLGTFGSCLTWSKNALAFTYEVLSP